jgi:hypothetical protein
MVRSIYTADGLYAGRIWGDQAWGSPDIGTFYGKASGVAQTVMGPFRKTDHAADAVRREFARYYENHFRARYAKPPLRQMSLAL